MQAMGFSDQEETRWLTPCRHINCVDFMVNFCYMELKQELELRKTEKN